MKPDCEVSVDAEDLRAALVPFGAWYEEDRSIDCVTLAPCGQGMQIIMPVVTAQIATCGRWTRVVQVSGYQLLKLASLAGDGPVTLGFTSDRLYFNRTIILAIEEAGALAPIRAESQFLLPGVAPISDAERMAVQVGRKLTPRVSQKPLSGVPLFTQHGRAVSSVRRPEGT